MTDKFPHICFVAPNAYPLLSGEDAIQVIGGAELQVVIVAKRLAARGRRVSMICLDFGQRDEIAIDGVIVFRAYRPDEGLPILRFLWPRLTSMWKCLKHADADIYYQQTAGMLTGVIAAFCRYHGRKSVFASASNPDLEPNTSRIQYARDRWIYSYGLQSVDRIFVQNSEQARLCRVNVGREPILVPNCYPSSTKQPAGVGDRNILWVSTVRKLKRPELFLNLAEKLPNLRFRMIGGPGDDEHPLFESIKARAERIQNVEFLGFVPFSGTEEYFDRASVFVNTSESEGFPNTFLQAWGRGIPTVSFVDAGASFQGKPIGLKVDSLEEMVATVADLAANDATRLKEGQRCAAYVEQNHSPETIVDLYEEMFEDLVRPNPTAAAQAANRNENAATGDQEQ